MFANPGQHLAPTAEKKVYDQHRSHPGDLGYRHFLNQLLEPLVQCLGALPLCGLDCGSGPGPTLSLMLSDLGYQMSIYDPYYATNSPTANARFDFVTCTEAIEHFYTPWREWD